MLLLPGTKPHEHKDFSTISIRHQAEKRHGQDKPNNGLIEVQMIICKQTDNPKESEAQVMVDLLAITRS